MDTSEYMPMFVAETREHLEHLNLAIVRLEENPRDRPTVEEIFRIAHSLKGMAATMGFSRVAELTHEMEDVFELLRQRTNGLPVEAIDTVFACLDACRWRSRRSRPTVRRRSTRLPWSPGCARSSGPALPSRRWLVSGSRARRPRRSARGPGSGRRVSSACTSRWAKRC